MQKISLPTPVLRTPTVDPGETFTAHQEDSLLDTFGRRARDLRISLTDFCNLRCSYCMPEEGVEFMSRDTAMTAEEIVHFVRIGVEKFGVDQVRFTGGEPLTRKDVVDIIAGVAALEPRPNIALTTNAIGLDKRAAKLRDAGLDRINVSLDTVDPDTFATITRRPFLNRVLEGIQGAQAAGLDPVKVNAVLLPGVNDHQAPDLLRWCLERGLKLRFIEQMPLDAGHSWERGTMITAADIFALLEPHFVLIPDSAPRNGAPAEKFLVASKDDPSTIIGDVGIIASVTRPFCADCTRTRLTAEGRVRTCLFSHTEVDLLTAMRDGADDEAIANLWKGAHWKKLAGHGMDSESFEQPQRPMSAIGG
ncbi:MAG: GTP 3',8-cyclase MoaA [Brevibacterium sp.]|uniref:GTP 3',8-cyclase MoaA n=1 Tax=Brevibacterium sp. TaxID=1701 RepID=UPI00264A17ED|nr:GTP 3',8-cyclase MoaA [Brevibacterium sp.]MDN5806136.1 GTP 3',8-cyclase MoaA [Brevibacterium sp.]MDN5832644.1 GTP 3',8-cyclase MoaA [Brevibacterium sp.]MDN5875494.1 GTP 3',8-cyclase MoaA [Brevibacterium sp.]MDN5908468.1 GTP 3',8-cyclase MoaA [Brevibacterium sp.]MDN6123557.1 GTP 3',8-cyclase MoaA [Brevibacterium sp.]